MDVARAFGDLAQDDVAVAMLLDAERQAPQLVRHNVKVREMIRTIYKRAPATKGGRHSDMMNFAERCRAV